MAEKEVLWEKRVECDRYADVPGIRWVVTSGYRRADGKCEMVFNLDVIVPDWAEGKRLIAKPMPSAHCRTCYCYPSDDPRDD